jgi:ribosome maturation factor RimP
LIPFDGKFCYNAPRFADGLRARFSFVDHDFMDAVKLVETTVNGMGYELVDIERSGRGLLRVFIDKPEGISVDDCQVVSKQLTRLFLVENVDYDRLEVSSPGLDRPLKKEADFVRFAGEKAQVKLRMAMEGRRNFVGVIGNVRDGILQLDVDGNPVAIDLSNLDKARLVPTF